MRASLVSILFLLLWPQNAFPQSPPVTATADTALDRALRGSWVGVLEYRDYSEPVTSTKRVQLPTWVSIRPAPEGVFLDTTYDDGPSKVVFTHEALIVDLKHGIYRTSGTDAVLDDYTIDASTTLRDAHGTLKLHGKGTDAGKPAEIQVTWTVRRNLISWLEEVRPAGSSGAFAFRHVLTLTRADPPKADHLESR